METEKQKNTSNQVDYNLSKQDKKGNIMNDFVTLSCPSCGGKLNVQKNSPTYVCQFCGQTHKLREQDIEFFGRCPKCHRNDRVEKLTAISNKHDHLAMKFRPPENLKAVRYHRLLDSTKADKNLSWITIDEKQESIYTKKSKLFGIASLVALVAFLTIASNAGPGSLVLLGLVLLLGSIALFVFAIIDWIKGKQDYNKYQKDLFHQKSIQTQKLKKRYDEIYYCQRDDSLFIPGEEGFASGSDYEELLTQALDTNLNVE